MTITINQSAVTDMSTYQAKLYGGYFVNQQNKIIEPPFEKVGLITMVSCHPQDVANALYRLFHFDDILASYSPQAPKTNPCVALGKVHDAFSVPKDVQHDDMVFDPDPDFSKVPLPTKHTHAVHINITFGTSAVFYVMIYQYNVRFFSVLFAALFGDREVEVSTAPLSLL